jgi:formylglycine-generating enzyme required for sulfatase activity
MSDTLDVKVGGPVDATEQVYVVRASDREFIKQLRAGEYVNVVTSRQMGKTSLVYRTMALMEGEGYRFAYFDLSPLKNEDSPQLYFQGVVKALARKLKLDLDLPQFWARHADESLSLGFMDFFRVALERLDGRIVIILDEIDSTLERDFTDDLFTAIRSLYTSRPEEPALKRLSFCLVGVATPNELIKARRTTPYNIGRTLWLADFDPLNDDLSPFLAALHADPDIAGQLLMRILHWTGGQPYLTARLCEEARRKGAATAAAIDALVEHDFTSLDGLRQDAHFEQTLRFINERAARSGDLMSLYERLLKGESLPDQAANIAYAQLKLSGLARRDGQGRLRTRNRLYEKLFDLSWVAASKPRMALTRARRLAYGAMTVLFLALVGGGLYYETTVVPLQAQQEARQQLERLQVTLEGGIRGFTLVGLPRQDRGAVFERALPHLQSLAGGREPSRLAFTLSEGDGISLAQVARWSTLARLAIRDPQLADLSPLAGMVGLKELDLFHTAVSDVSPLAGLGRLEALDLGNTAVRSLAPLARLGSLRRLYLSNSAVDDVTPLAGMVGLKELDLSHTAVSDLSPLAGLDRLEALDLGNTAVRSLALLTRLGALRRLDLSNTAVDDVTPLAALIQLEELDLSRTRVHDPSPLTKLPALRHLALDGLGLRGFDFGRARVLEDPPPLTGAPRAGQVFRDCPACPQMVALPSGSFTMGSPADEAGRDNDEGSQHLVQIRSVAVARFEIRFDEWALCVADGACPPLDDYGLGRGARPAIRLSWDEAYIYARWLSKKSGQPYRLLSEAEWEYAARAGSVAARFWGDGSDQACAYANVADESAWQQLELAADWKLHKCSDGFATTAPVGSYLPNEFGLYDVLGNVWEWTEDCYIAEYRPAFKDGRPMLTADCPLRVLRGGSWNGSPRSARSAVRIRSAAGTRGIGLGFRLARTLSP